MNLTLTLEEELTILDKYRLTPNELLFIQTLLILQEDGEEEYFSKCIKVLKQAGVSLRDIIASLQEKEIILKSYKILDKGAIFDPNVIPFNKNFVKNLYKASFELGKELFEEYPAFGNVGGTVVGLRSVSKKFDSLEQFYFKYGKAIGFNPNRHAEIIELVKWGRENNLINYTLASFLVDNKWLELNALKNGDQGNINYNTVKSL